MTNDMQELRYRIGDLMGDYAPSSFRRKSSSSEWIIGLGSIVAAFGISYLAMRMADRRLSDVIERLVPRASGRKPWERSRSRSGGGDRIPEAASAEMFRPEGHESGASMGDSTATERARPSEQMGQPSGNRH